MTIEHDASNFNDWLGQLPHKHKVVIAGNHEVCKNTINIRDTLKNAIYLESETVVVEGVKIHGAPHHRQRGFLYKANAFGLPDVEIKAKWEEIPDDVDILMTHIPPYGILDEEDDGHVGCPSLYDAVQKKKPALHCFGHVHGQRGCATVGADTSDGTVYCNAATLRNRGMNAPVVVDFDFKLAK
jgi:Icc-related predicted phosphoesterase